MKKFLDFLKNVLVIILLLASVVSINVYMLLHVSSKMISKKNVTNIVKEVDLEDIIGEETTEEVYGMLEEAGIKKEHVNSVLENEKLKETVGNYLSETVEAVLEEKELPKLEEKELTETLTSVFDAVVDATDTYNITEEEKKEIHEAIKEYVPEIVETINNSEDALTNILDESGMKREIENNETVKLLRNAQDVYQKRGVFLGITIALLVVIVLLKLKEFRFLKWLSAAGILYGVIFITISLSIPFIWNEFLASELAELKDIFDLSIKMITNTYLSVGIVSLIVGIILGFVKPIIKKIKAKKETEITN